VVPEAGNVGKAEVENFGVVLLGELNDGLGVSHENSLPGMRPFTIHRPNLLAI
jgi:hypothetical protein